MRYLILLAIIISLKSFSQPFTLKGYIKNLKGDNLSFTSISYTNKFGGVVADENGFLKLSYHKVIR